MLSTDNIILDILLDAKKQGNKLLQKFKINYPNSKLAQENNVILVAVVSSENNLNGYDFEQFRDLVEILIVTKQKDNLKSINVIKTVSNEVCRLIMENKHLFPNKPVIRNINPYFDVNMILTRGQIMVQCNTEPVEFSVDEADIENVCNILSEDNIDIE